MGYRLDTRSLVELLLIIIVVVCGFLFLYDGRVRYLPNTDWRIGDPIEDMDEPRTRLTPDQQSLRPFLQDERSQKNIPETPNGTLDRSDPLNVERGDSFDALIEKPKWNEPIFSTSRVKPEKE